MIIHPFIVKKYIYIGWKIDLKAFIVNTLTNSYMLKERNDEPYIFLKYSFTWKNVREYDKGW